MKKFKMISKNKKQKSYRRFLGKAMAVSLSLVITTALLSTAVFAGEYNEYALSPGDEIVYDYIDYEDAYDLEQADTYPESDVEEDDYSYDEDEYIEDDSDTYVDSDQEEEAEYPEEGFEYEDEYEIEEEEEIEELALEIEPMYIGIMPLSFPVSDFAGLEAAIAGNESVIIIENDIDFPLFPPWAITIPAGNDITLISGPGGPFAITQNNGFRHFIVNGTLTLEDVTLCGGSSAASGGGVNVSNGGTFIMNNGKITNTNWTTGGGVLVSNGSSFIMNGGEISNNNATQGGGVYVHINSSFVMNNGEISQNSASGGGGLHLHNSSFTMDGGEISDNTTTWTAGGIQVFFSTVTMNDGKINNNISAGTGGGVRLTESTFNMLNGEISGNEATNGGGIWVWESTVNMTDGEISNNEASANGGGIWAQGAPPNSRSYINMAGGEISGNTAVSGNGGGVAVNNDTTFTMKDGVISGNNANPAGGGSGGGVHVTGGSTFFIMEDGTISNNNAWFGGGVSTGNSTFVMENGTISSNNANGNGGGVVVSGGTFTMENGEIIDNTAVGNGGGVLIDTTFIMQNGLISGNTSTAADGGGVYIIGGIFTMEDGKISNNTAQNGGGISALFSDLTIENGLISGNTATVNGGGIFTNDHQTLTTADTVIFVGNSAAQAFLPPANALILYPDIEYASTTFPIWYDAFVHPLNNYDINTAGPAPLILFQAEYRANGGTGANHTDIILADSSYTIRTPAAVSISRVGFTFEGWNTAANGSGTHFDAGQIIPSMAGNIILYAQWQAIPPNYFQVIYNANGGTGGPHTDTIQEGTVYTILTLAAAGISRPGYTFTGWNTEANGAGTAFAPGDVMTIIDYVTLYAQWAAQIPGIDHPIIDGPGGGIIGGGTSSGRSPSGGRPAHSAPISVDTVDYDSEDMLEEDEQPSAELYTPAPETSETYETPEPTVTLGTTIAPIVSNNPQTSDHLNLIGLMVSAFGLMLSLAAVSLAIKKGQKEAA